MCLTWFFITKEKLLFFHCSSVYVVKHKPIYYVNYEHFTEEIVHLRSEPKEEKFGPIGKYKTLFITGYLMPEHYLKLGDSLSLYDYAIEIKKLVEKENKWIEQDYCIWLFGYNKEKGEMEGYHVCYAYNYEPFKIRIPNIEILSATHEPRIILEDIIYDKEFNKESIQKLRDHPFINKRMNEIMDKMLRHATALFDDINRQYPAYVKPLRIGKLDKDGFKYLK